MWIESQTMSRLVAYLVSLLKGVPELVPLHMLECTEKTLLTTSLKKLWRNINNFTSKVAFVGFDFSSRLVTLT